MPPSHILVAHCRLRRSCRCRLGAAAVAWWGPKLGPDVCWAASCCRHLLLCLLNSPAAVLVWGMLLLLLPEPAAAAGSSCAASRLPCRLRDCLRWLTYCLFLLPLSAIIIVVKAHLHHLLLKPHASCRRGYCCRLQLLCWRLPVLLNSWRGRQLIPFHSHLILLLPLLPPVLLHGVLPAAQVGTAVLPGSSAKSSIGACRAAGGAATCGRLSPVIIPVVPPSQVLSSEPRHKLLSRSSAGRPCRPRREGGWRRQAGPQRLQQQGIWIKHGLPPGLAARLLPAGGWAAAPGRAAAWARRLLAGIVFGDRKRGAALPACSRPAPAYSLQQHAGPESLQVNGREVDVQDLAVITSRRLSRHCRCSRRRATKLGPHMLHCRAITASGRRCCILGRARLPLLSLLLLSWRGGAGSQR